MCLIHPKTPDILSVNQGLITMNLTDMINSLTGTQQYLKSSQNIKARYEQGVQCHWVEMKANKGKNIQCSCTF